MLCLGGFASVVAGAGPGDSLYGLRTMIFGEQPAAARDDAVVLAAQTQMAEVQQLIDQGQWQAAQDKLQTLTTTVATVNDDERKQDLVTEWQAADGEGGGAGRRRDRAPWCAAAGLPRRAGGCARHTDVVLDVIGDEHLVGIHDDLAVGIYDDLAVGDHDDVGGDHNFSAVGDHHDATGGDHRDIGAASGAVAAGHDVDLAVHGGTEDGSAATATTATATATARAPADADGGDSVAHTDCSDAASTAGDAGRPSAADDHLGGGAAAGGRAADGRATGSGGARAEVGRHDDLCDARTGA